MAEMWICEYQQMPGIKWGSSSDQTGFLPGLVCRRLEAPLPGSSLSSWATFRKLAQLIEEVPIA